MKKLIIVVALVFAIAVPSYAQTVEEAKLISLLQQIIVLLQQQLELLIKQRQAVIGVQTVLESPPVGVAESMPKKLEIKVVDPEIQERVDKDYNTDEERSNMQKDIDAGRVEKVYHWECTTWTGGVITATEEQYQNSTYLKGPGYSCKKVVTLRIKEEK